MRVVSWDVGIKNLAYCIVEKSDNKSTPYIIHEWDVINLVTTPDIKCCFAGCQKGCNDIKTFCSFMGTNKYFCKDHKTYHSVWKNNYDDVKQTAKESKEGECAKCGKAAKWKVSDISLCTVHKNASIKKWDKEIEQIKFSPSKVSTVSVDDLKLRLLRTLDSKPSLLQATHVCIENQPSLKNPQMKAISDTLYAWFLIRGILDREQNKSLIKKVAFIAPSSKLKIEGFAEDIQKEIIESDNKYKTTKALAVQHTRIILKDCPQYLARLDSFKKKDDPADAFLHAVHFLSR
jgi:hypothetical protein